MMAIALGVLAGFAPWLWVIHRPVEAVHPPKPMRLWSSVVPFQRHLNVARMRRRQTAALPDTLEVLAIGVSVGMPLEQVVGFAIRCVPAATRPWFEQAQRSLAVGHGRRAVLAALGDEGGPEMVSVTDVLISSDRDGAPVALVLDRLAAEANRLIRLGAEERTRRIPVLMLAPLTLCSLPAVMIGTVLPFVLLSFGQTSF